MKKITWPELNAEMLKFNEEHGYHSKGNPESMQGAIVFTKDSFTKEYSEESRTYVFSSDNKAFLPGLGGYSIFASCLDGTDPCVRIEQYMFADTNPWKVEYCYIPE